MNDKCEKLVEIGKGAASAIREMVNALTCDYERMEELRDEREDWTDEDGTPTGESAWAKANPKDAEELAALEYFAGECESRDDAEERIREDPLSLEFRSGWVMDKSDMEAEEFRLLLATGGPAVRIIGEIRGGEAHRPVLQIQDWGTPWTDYYEGGLTDILMAYCSCFYFE